MIRYKIGKMYRHCLQPFEYCFVNGHTVQDALAKAHRVLQPNHMQILTVVEKVSHQHIWDYNVAKAIK